MNQTSLTQTERSPWRDRLAAKLSRPLTEKLLIVLILLNAVTLGLETYPALMARFGDALTALDRLILTVFVVEIALRITAHGWRFFKDPWSIFDFIVVGIALIPASGAFSVLRTLRILRVLRILTLVPSMKRVVGGLLGPIPGLSSVVMVISLIFYVSSVIATKLFSQTFPQWFGTLGESAYTLFQVMTLESWSMGIARPVLEQFPYAWIFFVLFILISTFTMLNLFIAVIVNAIQAEHDAELAEAGQETNQHVDDQHQVTRQEIVKLQTELAQIKQILIDQFGRGETGR